MIQIDPNAPFGQEMQKLLKAFGSGGAFQLGDLTLQGTIQLVPEGELSTNAEPVSYTVRADLKTKPTTGGGPDDE